MTYFGETFAEQEPLTKLLWLQGEIITFTLNGSGVDGHEPKVKFIHLQLLQTRCPSASFSYHWKKVRGVSQKSIWHTSIEGKHELGFCHFLLWLYADEILPVIESWEKDYLAAFSFAQEFHLREFEDFLNECAASSAVKRYGSRPNEEAHPTVDNLIFAATTLDIESKASEFFIEQFVRSWIYRRAYSEKEFDDLVDNYPDVAKLLFQRTQDVVRMDFGNAVATFGKCGAKSTVHDEEHVEEQTNGGVVPADSPSGVVVEIDEVEETPDATTEPETPVEPTLDDEESARPVFADRADGPFLRVRPTEAPPSDWEYRVARRRSRKGWRLVWTGERNTDEPIAEEPIPEEAPVEEAPMETQPQFARYDAIEAEPEPVLELVESYEEPGVVMPEVVETTGEAPSPLTPPECEPRFPDNDDEPVAESPERDSWGTEPWGSGRGTTMAY